LLLSLRLRIWCPCRGIQADGDESPMNLLANGGGDTT
jgi:hypothetical protein